MTVVASGTRWALCCWLIAVSALGCGGARLHGDQPLTETAAPPPVAEPTAEAVALGHASTTGAAAAPTRAKAELDEPPALAPKVHHPFHTELDARGLPQSAPARRFANLSPAQCRRELKSRKLGFKRATGPASGIATPLRFADSIDGIRFRAPGGRSVYGMLDCRLALVVSELVPVLRRHRIAVVLVDNMYRPRARLPGSRKRSQHSYGLAIDILGFELEDGQTLSVEADWNGQRGLPVCGPEADPVEQSDAAILLRNLVCDIARAGLFHHMLTPNYDAAHDNHFHFDIKRDDKGFLLK